MSTIIPEQFPSPHRLPEPGQHTRGQERPSRDEIVHIVANGTLAPSGGNFQPWKFHYQDGHLDCRRDGGRAAYFTNYRHNETCIGLGAAVTNIEVASEAIGYKVRVIPFPDKLDPDLVCRITFRAGDVSPKAQTLASAIPYRITGRFRGDRVPLGSGDGESLQQVAAEADAKLFMVTDLARLESAGAILGKMNQIGYLNPESHSGIVKMMRWTESEAAQTRDGIPVSTFELSPLEVTGMRFLTSYQVLRYIKNLGAARSLENMPVAWSRAASALCLLTLPEPSSQRAFFRAGQILERLWLHATLRNLAFHVLGVNSYFDRLEHGNGDGFSPEEQETLKRLRPSYRQLFGVPDGLCEAVLFRIVPPNPLVSRTFRLDVADVITFGGLANHNGSGRDFHHSTEAATCLSSE